MILSAAERSIWYSLSLRVWLGATTMESPVWMPMGSMFSMLQTVMQLSAASRMTSYSISFPALEVFLDENLADGAEAEAAGDDVFEFVLVAGDAPTGAAQGVGGPDDEGEAEVAGDVPGFGYGGGAGAARDGLADALHEIFEQFAVLGLLDGVNGGAQHADVIAV